MGMTSPKPPIFPVDTGTRIQIRRAIVVDNRWDIYFNPMDI